MASFLNPFWLVLRKRPVLLLLITLLGIAPAARAQAPTVVRTDGVAVNSNFGDYFTSVTATTTDAYGFVYLTGSFMGTATFGSFSLTSGGTRDMFIAKWHPSYGFQWVKGLGGQYATSPTAIAVNGTSIYVAGSFNSPTFLGLTNYNSGYDAGFVARFTVSIFQGNVNLNMDWANSVSGGGFGQAKVKALTTTGTDVYIAGWFAGGAGLFNNIFLYHPNGGKSAFVAKVSNTSGAYAWAKQCGVDGSNNEANAVAVNGTSVYLGGYIQGSAAGAATATFGNLTLTDTNYQTYDGFVAKLTDAGSSSSFTWVQGVGGTAEEQVTSLAVAGTSVYLGGYFQSATAALGSLSLANAGGGDLFVAKITDSGSAGSYTWAQRGGGTNGEGVTAMVASGGAVYISGTFYGGTTTLGTTTLTSNFSPPPSNTFVAKLVDTGANGSYGWAQAIYDDNNNSSLAVDGTSVYVGGQQAYNASIHYGYISYLTDQTPTLTGVSPGNGPVGTTLTLNGANLTGATSVNFGGGASVTAASGGFSVNAAGTQITGLAVPAGAASGDVSVTTPNGRSNGVPFTVLAPVLAVSQNGANYPNNSTYNAGNQLVNTSSAAAGFLLRNTGTAALAVSGVATTGNYTVSTSAMPLTIAAGGSATANLVFTPTATGPQTGTLVITSSLGTYTVNLSGNGTPVINPPHLTYLNPTSGPVGSSVTLSGTDLGGVSRVTFNGTVQTVIGSGNNFGVVVNVPTGATSGPVTVTNGDGTSNGLPFTVTVPQLAVSQNGTAYPSGGTAYNFGRQFRNVGSAATAFTLGNAGTAPLVVSSVTTTGDFALAGGAPTGVPPGGSATASVVFTPTATGPRAGTLVITSSLGTYTVNLSGNGTVPTLTSVAPTSGPAGSSITLTGTDVNGALRVSFNGTTTTSISSNSATSVVVTVPAGATSGLVTVTNPAGTTNGLPFTVTVPQLAVTQGSTNYPSGGAAYHFGTQLAGSSSAPVAFTLNNPGTAALTIASLVSNGDYALTGPVPTGVAAGGTGTVSVVFTPTGGGTRGGALVITSNAGTYTVNLTGSGVVPAPTLTGLSPTNGLVGSSVTLNGTFLAGAISASFNGTVVPGAAFTSNSTSSIVLTVPAGATTGPVTVTTPGGTTNGVTFTVNSGVPAFCGASVAGPGGALTLTTTFQTVNVAAGNRYYWSFVATAGTTYTFSTCDGNFGVAFDSYLRVYNAGGNVVDENDDRGPYCFSQQASMDFTPPGSGTYYLLLTHFPCLPLQSACTLNYKANTQPAPILTGISPVSGPVGSPLTLDGSNLTHALFINFAGSGSPAATSGFVVNAAGTQITGVLVPAGAATGPVSVTTPAGTSNPVNFTLTVATTPPSIGAFTPQSGGPGATVIISGGNFQRGTAGTGSAKRTSAAASIVRFNGVLAVFTVLSATQLSATVPVGATSGPITVSSADGTATSTSSFEADLTVSTAASVPAGAYHDFTVLPTGVAKLSGDVTVTGNLTVQAGGSLSDGCYRLLGSGNVSVAAGATLSSCNAAGLGSGGATGAVQVTGTRAFSPAANYVFNGSAAQLTGTQLPAEVRSLTVNNAAGLTLSQSVAVAQLLTVASTGNLNLNGQALTLLSDASGTALVVNGGTGVVTGGTATVQRYLTTTNPGLGYRHYSSPVSGNRFTDLGTATFTPVFSAAYNAATAPLPAAGFPTVLGYDQGRMNTSAYAGFNRGWFSPLATDAMSAACGYAVNLRGTEVVDFTGTLRTGDYVRTLARATGSVGGEGLHLVGNPYPAPLDWSRVDATADRPGVDGAIYVFESSGPYAGAYRSYANGLGGSPLIGSSQGFFVRVSQGQTSGSLTFHNSQRLTSYGTQVAVRRGAADARPQVQLRLTAPTGGADDVFIYAEAGASPGLDSQFDASKLLNPSGLSLAAVATGGAELAIQGLPLPMVATVVPLTLRVPGAGTYALTAPALHSVPASTQVLLVDALTGQRLDLRTLPATGHAFVFSAAQAAQPVSGRFFLNLVPAGAPLASAAALTAAAVQVYPNPVRPGAGLTVLLPPLPSAQPVQVALLNILGQVVRQLPAATWSATGHLVLPTQGLAPGVYAVRVVAGAVSVAKRVVVE